MIGIFEVALYVLFTVLIGYFMLEILPKDGLFKAKNKQSVDPSTHNVVGQVASSNNSEELEPCPIDIEQSSQNPSWNFPEVLTGNLPEASKLDNQLFLKIALIRSINFYLDTPKKEQKNLSRTFFGQIKTVQESGSNVGYDLAGLKHKNFDVIIKMRRDQQNVLNKTTVVSDSTLGPQTENDLKKIAQQLILLYEISNHSSTFFGDLTKTAFIEVRNKGRVTGATDNHQSCFIDATERYWLHRPPAEFSQFAFECLTTEENVMLFRAFFRQFVQDNFTFDPSSVQLESSVCPNKNFLQDIDGGKETFLRPLLDGYRTFVKQSVPTAGRRP